MINTKRLIEERHGDGSLESYALIVGYKGEEWITTSSDVNLDTYFDAASIGKILPTTTLALKALDKGLLSLDDTLDKFFPNVPEDKKQITVKHLITHTSGMYRKEFPDNVADRGRESVAEFILSVPLAYETGKGYAYCCTGMILLGFIIEKVFDMTLDVALEELICKPLGLTKTRYNLPHDEPNAINCHHNLAVTDIRWDDNNVTKMNGIPAGPGGNYTPPRDLHKCVTAILRKDECLYSKEMYAFAEQNRTDGLNVGDIQRGVENHALGYTYVNKNCAQACDLFPDGSIGHDGTTGQSFYLNRDLDLYVILMSNANRANKKKRGSEANYAQVCELRAEFHRAIKKDLGL
ncbi:MAG: beta-lactamase family protein [Clostridia bacterium]|nr:beta-lactamase family protein [Clostridia bacterium]